jgi:uncharacterized membrane protein
LFEALFKYSRAEFERGTLVFTSALPGWVVPVIGLAGFVLMTLLVARRYGEGKASRLATVLILQAAMLGLALFVLLQPAIRTEESRPGVNTLALVLDSSGSMGLGEGAARIDTAKARLAQVARLAEERGIGPARYLMGENLRPVTSFDEASGEDAATDIAGAVREVLSAGSTRALAGVVLVSDGIDTGGAISSEALAELAAYGVPVHTIAVGRERIPEDLELVRVSVPVDALPGSTVTARVAIRHDGAAAARLKVYDADTLVQSLPLELPADKNTTTLAVDIPLDEAGYHRLRFELEGDAAEPETRNNRSATLVNVAGNEFRILYYEGEPRWEYKFLRRSLASEDDIALATLLQVSPNKFYRQGIATPEELADGFPASRDALFAYDALIIGSVEAASFTPEQLENVRAFVSERGGSLMLIAGPAGLGNGGWGQSRIADLLPVLLPPSTESTFVREKVVAQLTPQGASWPPLRLAASDDENIAAWDGLPEVADYQRTAGLKPAARTLLTAQTPDGDLPLLVTQPFGRGHTFVLATGGTWRWQMSLPVADQRHERFWRQLLRALVSNAPKRTSIVASKGASSAVSLRAEVRDEGYSPVGDATVSAVLTHESGDSESVELVPAGEPGVFSGEFEPQLPGNWYVEAMTSRAGEPEEVMRTGIYVEPESREHTSLRANPALLRRIADATGGQHLDADDLSALPDALRYSSAGITETVDRPFWDAPAFFALLLLLKSSEWLLRRRWSTI